MWKNTAHNFTFCAFKNIMPIFLNFMSKKRFVQQETRLLIIFCFIYLNRNLRRAHRVSGRSVGCVQQTTSRLLRDRRPHRDGYRGQIPHPSGKVSGK